MQLPAIATPDAPALADALAHAGACRILTLAPRIDVPALLQDAQALEASGALQPAGVGRTAQHDTHIRGDRTHWLGPYSSAAALQFLGLLEELTHRLRVELRFPLHKVEAHYACYAPGAAYARHRDRLRDSGARLLTWVSYLNDDWRGEDGGALRIYHPSGVVDIPPLGGTSVVFSSELEHEVLPAVRSRYSIAAWMRRVS